MKEKNKMYGNKNNIIIYVFIIINTTMLLTLLAIKMIGGET